MLVPDPRIADDILLVIDPKEAQMEISRVKRDGSDDTEKNNATIELPWTGCRREGWRVGFYLAGVRYRLSAAERLKAAVARALDRILFLWTEGTICFDVKFNRVWQFRTRKLACCVQNIFFREQLALPSALNIGAGAVSSIRQQN